MPPSRCVRYSRQYHSKTFHGIDNTPVAVQRSGQLAGLGSFTDTAYKYVAVLETTPWVHKLDPVWWAITRRRRRGSTVIPRKVSYISKFDKERVASSADFH
jgi:hypothetical protein